MENDFLQRAIAYVHKVAQAKQMKLTPLAKAVKLSPSTLTRMETHGHVPLRETIQKIEIWSKIPFDWSHDAQSKEFGPDESSNTGSNGIPEIKETSLSRRVSWAMDGISHLEPEDQEKVAALVVELYYQSHKKLDEK